MYKGAHQRTFVEETKSLHCHKTYIYCFFFREVLKTVKTLDNDEVEKIKPKRKENPDNVRRVEFILSEDNFEDLFPRRHRSYTYTRLLQVKDDVDVSFYNCL